MVSRLIPPDAQGIGEAQPFPAPVKGLNTRESYISLGPDEARELVNFLPQTGACTIRPGYSTFATGLSANPITNLINVPIGNSVSLLAISTAGVWNVVSGTAVFLGGGTLYTSDTTLRRADTTRLTADAVSTAAGYSGNRWSSDFMGGYQFAVNGTDTPWQYNGVSLSGMGFTGTTLANLRTVKNVQYRLWFTKANSGDTYYGPLEGVTGALSLFQISQIANGGYCMGVFPWQAQNATVFCMSTGQVLVYTGDPTTNIALATKYYAPPLVEPDAALQMGGELILITQSGPISMDLVASGLGFELDALGNWGKIWPAWQVDYLQYGSNPGWFGKFISGVAYFNIPTGGGTSKQYVFITRNQAWTNYYNLPLASLEAVTISAENSIYFGSCNNDGKVFIHSGGEDNGNPIVAWGRPGFSYLGAPGRRKVASLAKPNIFTTGSLSVQIQMDADFMTSPFTGGLVNMSAPATSTPWGSPWGSSWATTKLNNPNWTGVSGNGHALSLAVKSLSTGTDVQWFSSDVMVTGGGAL